MNTEEEREISAALVAWMRNQNISAGLLSIVMLKMVGQGLGDKATNRTQLIKLIAEAQNVILNTALVAYFSEDSED